MHDYTIVRGRYAALLLITGSLVTSERGVYGYPLALASYSCRTQRAGTLDARTFQSAVSGPLAASVSSWESIEKSFGGCFDEPEPLSIDTVLTPDAKPPFSSERPTLFRERHGWCPYSERVWLALELDNVAHDTIRIDNTGGGRPSYFSGQTPQMKWHDTGRIQGESMDLVNEIDKKYYDCSLKSNDKQVQDLVSQFRNIFPRARPSSRAAYLFQYNGEPLWKSTFETTLKETDELLSQSDGPFFAGTELTVADIAWAPFLERYRYQLPCLHGESLKPDCAASFPHLSAWYNAMDHKVPAYACRVKGDASSWRKVLSMAGFGNAGMPPQVVSNMDQMIRSAEIQAAEECIDVDLWTEYAASRPYVASSPGAQAALVITRNRNAIIKDMIKRVPWEKNANLPDNEKDIDAALKDLVESLTTQDNAASDLTTAKAIASFLDDRMCVPRDMGAMPAATIKLFASSDSS